MFIEGDRIYLREVRLTDANETYHRWINDAQVTRYLESRFYPHSIESLRDYVEQVGADRDNLFLAIVLKEPDRHIGNIKLGPINWLHRFADVGLLIGEKDCWGKGYATEAIKLVSKFAFEQLNLHRLNAGCYADNVGSAKAFLRAGWMQEGVRPRRFYCEGRYVDEILLGLLRSA